MPSIRSKYIMYPSLLEVSNFLFGRNKHDVLKFCRGIHEINSLFYCTQKLNFLLRLNNKIFLCSCNLQVLTSIGNFCICSIAVGMILEIIVMFPIQHRSYRDGINNLLVLLIGGIPIAMPTVLSVTLAIGSHRLSQQVHDNFCQNSDGTI